MHNATLTPKDFIKIFQSHHPDAGYSEVMTLLALIVQASFKMNEGKGMSPEELATDTTNQVKQFLYDLPLSDENYTSLMDILMRTLLEETYAETY